jgi:hypothetical protein
MFKLFDRFARSIGCAYVRNVQKPQREILVLNNSTILTNPNLICLKPQVEPSETLL